MKRSLFFTLTGMATLHMALPFFVDAGIAQDEHDSNWRQAYRVGIAGLPVASTSYVYISFEPYLPHGETTCSRCG